MQSFLFKCRNNNEELIGGKVIVLFQYSCDVCVLYDHSSSLPVAYCTHSEDDKDEPDPEDQTNDQTDSVIVGRVEIYFVPAWQFCGVSPS